MVQPDPFLIWEVLKHLDPCGPMGLHTKLAATWVPWRFGCSTGATDCPEGGVDWHRRKLDQKSSYHSWWHMQKAWWTIFRGQALLRNWSLFKQSFFAILSFWHPVVWANNRRTCSAYNIPTVNFTTLDSFQHNKSLGGSWLSKKKTAPGMNLMFGYAKKLTTNNSPSKS